MNATLDQRQVFHRTNYEAKKSVQLLYEGFHRRLLDSCPPGPVLDIGSGTAHIKKFRSGILSTDILSFPGIDVVADAHDLPFQDGSFSGIVMLDVLHHIERPIEFLQEAARVLRPGGRLVMLEPAMTTVGGWFYHHIHEEPVDMKADVFAPVTPDPNRDPFDANIAIPHLLFADEEPRRRVEKAIPSFKVHSVEWSSLFAYPMSGGLKKWSLIPTGLIKPMLAFEDMMPDWIRKIFAFRMMIVLEKI